MKHTFALAAVLAIGLATSASASVTIASDAGASESGLGSYVATLDYDSTTFKLTIDIENTSPLANGGYLTAFLLNSPTTDITGITLSSAPANFGLLGSTPFQEDENGQPFGYFDFGVSTGGGFQGGGPPSQGLGVGASGSFVFSFTGSNLGSLTTEDFVNAYSVLKGEDGEKEAQFFVARFRGFTSGGSDKVPAYVVPETGSLIVWGCLAAGGIPGLVWYRRRR